MRILLAALLLLLIGCGAKPLSIHQTDNEQVKVEIIGHFDGCTIYRFVDGELVHFVRCGGMTTAKWGRSCGKNCIKQIEVQTSSE